VNISVPSNRAGQSVSIRQHQKQILWQVWIPLSLGFLIVIALAALTIIGASHGSIVVTKWSHLSLIIMVIPVLFVGLILLTIIGAGIYGIAKLLNILPPFTGQVQIYAQRISITIKQRADQFLQPVFAIQAGLAALNRFWAIMRGKIPA